MDEEAEGQRDEVIAQGHTAGRRLSLESSAGRVPPGSLQCSLGQVPPCVTTVATLFITQMFANNLSAPP